MDPVSSSQPATCNATPILQSDSQNNPRYTVSPKPNNAPKAANYLPYSIESLLKPEERASSIEFVEKEGPSSPKRACVENANEEQKNSVQNETRKKPQDSASKGETIEKGTRHLEFTIEALLNNKQPNISKNNSSQKNKITLHDPTHLILMSHQCTNTKTKDRSRAKRFLKDCSDAKRLLSTIEKINKNIFLYFMLDSVGIYDIRNVTQDRQDKIRDKIIDHIKSMDQSQLNTLRDKVVAGIKNMDNDQRYRLRKNLQHSGIVTKDVLASFIRLFSAADATGATPTTT